MRLLITGAGGLLGGSLVAEAGDRQGVLGATSAELDVTDAGSVRRLVSDFRPQAVLHCAAYTGVDDAERFPERARHVNAEGSELVARAASEYGAVMAYVSTDYVFNGSQRVPYREGDAPSPLGVYGESKWEGEKRVAAFCPGRHLILRTGWLYGAGKGFVDWLRPRLAEQASIPLVADQTGSPTWAGHVARALLRLVEEDHRGLFHFVNKGETSWLDLGRAVAELMGRTGVRFVPITRSELRRPAQRPAYSALAVEKFEKSTGTRVAGWREALAEYLSSAPPTV